MNDGLCRAQHSAVVRKRFCGSGMEPSCMKEYDIPTGNVD